ncbi:MAG: hypothetical protein RLY58_37 [Pseudomonadota bacterium]
MNTSGPSSSAPAATPAVDPPATDHAAEAIGHLSPQVVQYIRELLDHRGLTLRFAYESLESLFLAQRSREYRTLVRPVWPMMLIMYVMLMGMAVQFFPTDVFSQQGLYLKLLLIPGLFSLLSALLLPQHRRLARHFELIITLAGGLLLVLLLLAVFCAVTLDFAFHASVNVNMMIMLTAFASRVRVSAFILMVVGATGTALLTALVIHAHVDWLKMGHFLLLYCTVVIFVMSLIEAKDRLAFLQTLILSQQANQLDQLNQQLVRVAREDVLSGLPNRQAFDELFHREWERTRRDQQPLALVYIDLDYFKLYNDNYGHLAGDAALQEVAVVLREALLRPADQACRYGGEAFMLILPNTTLKGATEVARRVIAAVDRLAMEHRWSQVAAHLTVSAGVATSIDEDTNELQFLRRVDNALYLAKRDGRHRFFVDTYSC